MNGEMVDAMADQQAEIVEEVRAFVERNGLLPGAGRVVVAVSGGADSLCLLGTLDALCGPGRAWPAVTLVVAHLDHGLRGEQAREDARWVAALARDLGLECRVGERDVAALAREVGRGVEDAARRARYAFLREVAREVGASRICLGHTRDDQVETLVMQWLRGSGLAGLVGMRPLANDVARPLLGLARARTRAYCAARGWEPRDDASNRDRRFWRNRIRHEVLPLLRRENPNLSETLVRNAELLAEDEAYLRERAAEAWASVAREDTAGRVALDAAGLMGLPGALRGRVLRRAATVVAGGEPALEARHVALLEALALGRRPGRGMHLPGGLRAWIEGETLVLAPRPVAEREPGRGERSDGAGAHREMDPVRLRVPGSVVLPGTGWRVRAELLDADAGSPPPGIAPGWDGERDVSRDMLSPAEGTAAAVGRAETWAYVDADAAGQPLWVRTWRPGDRFRPLGMSGEKKLHDYFVDARVPRAERARIPLVWGPSHLLWVAGHRLDNRVRITPATRRVLALRLEPVAGDE